MNCKYCGVPMKTAMALFPWVEENVLSIAPVGKATEIKKVMKCPKCGHSDYSKNVRYWIEI